MCRSLSRHVYGFTVLCIVGRGVPHLLQAAQDKPTGTQGQACLGLWREAMDRSVGWGGLALLKQLPLAVGSLRPGPPGGRSGQNVLWLVITGWVWASPRAHALQNCTFSLASPLLGCSHSEPLPLVD